MPDNPRPMIKPDLLRGGFEPDTPAPEFIFPVSLLRTSAPAVVPIGPDGKRLDGREE